MVSYIKAMSTLSRRFQSGNSVPIESARITKEEFDAIQEEIIKLKRDLYKYDKGVINDE